MTPSKAYYFSEFETPFGKFSVAVDSKGALAATAFGGRNQLKGRLGPGSLVNDTARTAAARTQLKDWLKGKRRNFSVGLSTEGSPFQRRVWAALRRIPYGETRSYGAIAKALGSSARAVGRANGTNPLCVVVPCHRVIGADGTLTGYAFGEATKRRLLELEGAGVTRP